MTISVHNDSVWVTLDNAKTITISDPSELVREQDGGKLPDSYSDNDIAGLVAKIHKHRQKNAGSTDGIRKVVPIFNAGALAIAVFWLGAALVVQSQPQGNQSAAALSPSAAQCSAGQSVLKMKDQWTPPTNNNAKLIEDAQKGVEELRALYEATNGGSRSPKSQYPFGHDQ